MDDEQARIQEAASHALGSREIRPIARRIAASDPLKAPTETWRRRLNRLIHEGNPPEDETILATLAHALDIDPEKVRRHGRRQRAERTRMSDLEQRVGRLEKIVEQLVDEEASSQGDPAEPREFPSAQPR